MYCKMFAFYLCFIIALIFLLFNVHLWNTTCFNMMCADEVLGFKEFAQHKASKQMGPHLTLRAAPEWGIVCRRGGNQARLFAYG